jgi:serine/threonine protein kinase
MLRTLEAVSPNAPSCVSCQSVLTDDRCGHCGAAAKAGPYRVLRVLSRSQHGAMYLAEDDTGAKVALKELVFSLVPTTQELDAFAREAELLQALEHPRIPKFLKSFTVGQGVSTRLYLAQQYLTGQTLTERLATQHFDEDEVLAIARQALQVLGYLHGRSPVVVHRDVKPDNFILAADRTLSLVDFGAARSVKAAGTHRATLVGTFGYMAPEQLGGTVDARSDLYGLGATLVHLLTRQPPERLLSAGMSLDFQKHVNVSAKTERFLSRLVAARPQQRFASAEDALAFLEGRSTSTPRTGSFGLVFAAVSLALFAGALVMALSRPPAVEVPVQQPVAPVIAEPVVVVPPPPVLDPVTLPKTAPPSGQIRFPHVKAKWNFGKPGYWVLDESGRGHHALLPTEGYLNDFFGLVWDGTSGLSVADSMDFAPRGPFTLSTRLRLSEGPVKKTTLISRGDPDGKFAWAAQLVPTESGARLRFSLSDSAGEVSTVEAPLLGASEGTIYFSFDPDSGEQRIVQNCVVSSLKTTLRPARELPAGSRLQLITGLRGIVYDIELMSGLMQPSKGGSGSCGYSGERMDED